MVSLGCTSELETTYIENHHENVILKEITVFRLFTFIVKLAVAYLVTGQANVLIVTSFSIIAINRSDDPHFVPTCRLCVANIALIERVTQIPRDVSDEKSMYIR